MDKVILKSTKECTYFFGNILVVVKVVFLLDCPLVLFLLKQRGVNVFFNQKN